MALRRIVRIDEALCDGCGQCLKACHEGALRIIEGKAKLIDEAYCDGLGACIGYCPKGAITLEERAAKPLLEPHGPMGTYHKDATHAPPTPEAEIPKAHPNQPHGRPLLRNWPIKLRLISPMAPFLRGAELLLAADCTSFVSPTFHRFLLPGRALIVGCTRFDEARDYAKRLEEILSFNDVRNITVVCMEVPCCQGLGWAATEAVKASGKAIPIKRVTLSLDGEVKGEERLG